MSEQMDAVRVKGSALKWVRLAKYCELSGDTTDAVYQRRKSLEWVEGVESMVGPDNKIWINLEEVERWVEGRNQPHRPVLKRHVLVVHRAGRFVERFARGCNHAVVALFHVVLLSFVA